MDLLFQRKTVFQEQQINDAQFAKLEKVLYKIHTKILSYRDSARLKMTLFST